MTLQLFFTLLILFAIIGLVIWFYNQKSISAVSHHRTINVLENAISINRNQIECRKLYLNKYRFLDYNLQEALVVQTNIEL